MDTKERKQKQLYTGVVVSDKMDKTVVVETVRTFTHPQFLKTVRTTKTYKVHDETGLANVGDIVEFYGGRPVSKTKYMYLARIVNHATSVTP
jgi:small subunit ribosomal protein S17